MIEVARRAVEAATAAGASDAEAYAAEDQGREVRAHGGEIESLSAATQRGVGIRAWIGKRVGYAYGTDLSQAGVTALAGRAAEAARAADEDEFAGPPSPTDTPVRSIDDMPGKGTSEREIVLSDPTMAEWSPDQLADLTLAIEEAALAADSRIAGVEQAVYADSAERVAIVSSVGIEGEYSSSSCYGYVQALAAGEDGRETGLGFGLGRAPTALDPVAIGREGAERAATMIGAGKPKSRSCPVVLDPTVAASFIALIGRGLAASAVQRGRSPFAERLGEEVANEALSLRDDGLDPEGFASAPFDAEGVPRRSSALIEASTLRTYLYDTYTANRGEATSTGSASRSGYRSQPSVATSNLIVAPGELGFAELLGEAGDGVLVTDVAGLHSGVNPVSGVFSVGASGRVIRDGELAEPLREFTIASDLVSMLRAVRAVGSDSRWVPFGGSVRTPSLLVSEMTVAGS
ncbi:MAG TPA: TldD/PmbA family protein [Solirubrobacterales bacterium]|nr:TldD/PmbA family protein [Solirubrobacterales bacterium]